MHNISYFRYDLNDSLLKTRHTTITKASQLTNIKSNHFVNDVFELLDLDFDEYIRQVIFQLKNSYKIKIFSNN